MSADSERAEHLRRALPHYEAMRATALDDNGLKDISRQQCKIAGELRRITGSEPKGAR
jgi:hypothetical protein